MSPVNLFELNRLPGYRTAIWKRNFYLAAALVLDLAVLGLVAVLHVESDPPADRASLPFLGYHLYFAFDRPLVYVIWAALILAQVLFGQYVFRKTLDGEGMVSLFPSDASKGRRFGSLTGPELVETVHELAGQMGVGPVRRIIVHDEPDPNAYTTHLLGVGNVVVLHANLLEVLPRDGVRAVIAHEIAHIRNSDAILYLVASLPRAFLTAMGLLILWKAGAGLFDSPDFGTFLLRLLFVGLLWTVATRVRLWLGRIANLASQQSEYIADAHAALACGREPMLNALLLIGERSEALQVLAETLREARHLRGVEISSEELLGVLRRFPARELDDARARKIATRLYIEHRLAELRESLRVPLSEEQIVDLAWRAEKALREQCEKDSKETDEERASREKLQEEAEKLLLDWRQYDLDRSGHLDAAEIEQLVDVLKRQPEKMIFRQFLASDASWQSHPRMRERLLFLCGLPPGSPDSPGDAKESHG